MTDPDPAALLRHVLAELTQIGRDVRTVKDALLIIGQPAIASRINRTMARIASLISAVVAPTEQAAAVDNSVLATVNARLARIEEQLAAISATASEEVDATIKRFGQIDAVLGMHERVIAKVRRKADGHG